MKSDRQSGGVNSSGSSVSVAGDIVGRDKISSSQTGLDQEGLEKLLADFSRIKLQIEQRPEDQDVDKEELHELVENIEQEVVKGEAANPNKVERWLRFLAELADDVFQITAASLTHPVSGVAKAIQKIAQRAAKGLNHG